MMWQGDTIELLRSASNVAVPGIAADGTRRVAPSANVNCGSEGAGSAGPRHAGRMSNA